MTHPTFTTSTADFCDIPLALGLPPETAAPAPGTETVRSPADTWLEWLESPEEEKPETDAPAVTTIDRVERTLRDLDTLADELALPAAEAGRDLGYLLPVGFKLSIVIPCYNEERTIRRVIDAVRALPLETEIIVVDDGSQDGTRAILAGLDLPGVRVILKEQNAGKGAALRTGFAAATGDVVVVQDADLEYDPTEIPRLLRPIVEGHADVVFGSRFLADEGGNSSLVHRFGNGVLTTCSNLLTGLRITDMETCYKVFRRDLLQSLPLAQDRFGFEPEVTAKIARRGWRVAELPIRYHGRTFEEGKKIGLKDAFEALYCIVRYAWCD